MINEIIEQAKDSITVKRVFGEPYERNGVTFIPAAKIQGGGGGGGDEKSAAGGGGFGVSSRPVGAFVIKGDSVTWQPTLDINRVVLGAQVVAIFALLVLRTAVRRRRRRLRRSA